MKKLFVSAKELKYLCKEFCEKVKKMWKEYKTLILITKWALIPWYYIADMLWIKDIRTICVNSYIGKNQSSLQIHYMPDIDTDNILVFDELTDTWETLSWVKSKMPIDREIDYWILFKFKQSSFTPDIYCREKWDEWIDFYYEN